MIRSVLPFLLLVSTAAAAQTPLRTTIAGSGDFAEQASSPVVRPGYGRLFSKASDGGLYYLSDADAETNLLTGGASAPAILAALLTVDGAGSLLDADFLDGISSGGFCLTDGTRVYTGNISFEGATADTFETSFAIVDPTADRTITFKDGSGTVAFTSDIVNMTAGDILAALLTVDGAASLLDADFLDGLSSAAFALVAGGNAFASSNTYAANDITDADVSDTLTASLIVGAGSTTTAVDLATAEVAGVLDQANLDVAVCLLDASRAFTGNLVHEGLTADAFETTFVITDPTADRTVTFKDASGTVAYLTDITNMSAADILAALITVDGAASGLDADLLDGQSSAAYALVAGGNAFASSNTYAANDITDADVVDTLTCSNYLPLVGGAMTGGVAFSGVTTDITSATGEDLMIMGGGTTGSTGGIRLESRNDTVDFVSADGFERGMMSISNSGGMWFNSLFILGSTTDAAASSGVIYLRENTYTSLAVVYGGGAIGISTQQAITISTGLDQTSPTSSQVELTCTTPACSYSPGETSVVDGWQIHVCNNDATDNIALTSAAGTVVVTGSPRAMTPGECASCVYSGGIWGCQ